MLFFKTRKRDLDAQQFLARLANRMSLENVRSATEPRCEARTAGCIGIWVIPLAHGKPDLRAAFPAITKDLTCKGIGYMAHQPPATAEEVLLAVPEETAGRLLHVNVRNQQALGAGWYLLGAEVIELLDVGTQQKWNGRDRKLFDELVAW